jgi:hypothetical protein
MGTVVVAVGNTSTSRAAAQWAAARARATAAHLKVVASVPVPAVATGADGMALCFLDRAKLVRETTSWLRSFVGDDVLGGLPADRVEYRVELGGLVTVISGHADNADLLVLGSARRGRYPWLGRRCRRRVRCPIVVIDEQLQIR